MPARIAANIYLNFSRSVACAELDGADAASRIVLEDRAAKVLQGKSKGLEEHAVDEVPVGYLSIKCPYILCFESFLLPLLHLPA